MSYWDFTLKFGSLMVESNFQVGAKEFNKSKFLKFYYKTHFNTFPNILS